MLEEKDLQAISQLLAAQLAPINERLERLEEGQEEIRGAIGHIAEWAEACGEAIQFPLPRL